MRPGIIMLCCILLSFTLSAQQAPIAIVSTNGATKLVNTLNEAAQQSQDNDIIYLPAGNFAGNSGIWFTKRVTVIGVGHHPDSASANGRTIINGDIGFQNPGSEGSTLDGVLVTGTVYVSSNCRLVRTSSEQIFVPNGWTGENISIDQCIVTNIVSSNQPAINNAQISNSFIIKAFAPYLNNSTFQNCIFLSAGTIAVEPLNLNTFRNCIFPNLEGWGTTPINSFFYNNIFSASELPPLTNAGNASRNILGQTPAATFVQQSGTVYQYDQNYRLKAGSPGINAGTDGKDIGIYGGQKPYDDFAIPPNPSIRKREIDAETTPAGTLRVRFNVRVN